MERPSASGLDGLEGRLWVISAVLTVGRSLPVYPDEETSCDPVGMSQTCQEEKCDLTARRSAIEGFYLPQVF